jgi:hypothetical protein
MNLFVRALITGIWVSLLTCAAMGKGPKPSYEDCTITGDILSDGVITVGVGVRGWTEVKLWLSASILAIDGVLLESHALGEDPLWPSGEDPPLWIGEDPYVPQYFTPSPELVPDEGEAGRHYFGNARLMKGENDSRFDFDFSPYGPCTSPSFGERTPPIPYDDYDEWVSWWNDNPQGPPPTCPFMLVLLGGHEDSISGDVTFDATDDLFLVRNGGYPRVMLADFTLGPLCPQENSKPGKGKKNPSPPPEIPEGGCVKPGGYDVGTGPVGNPIVFDFSQN